MGWGADCCFSRVPGPLPVIVLGGGILLKSELGVEGNNFTSACAPSSPGSPPSRSGGSIGRYAEPGCPSSLARLAAPGLGSAGSAGCPSGAGPPPGPPATEIQWNNQRRVITCTN